MISTDLPALVRRFLPRPRPLLFAVVFVGITACATAASQQRRLLEQAQDLNIATRFGRIDVASQLAAPAAKATFVERRAQWGRDIRVLDAQVNHVQLNAPERAEVTVQVDWTRMNEGTLRSTWLVQTWHAKASGPWLLESEKRSQGDAGLFGELPRDLHPRPQVDRHFETRSLGSTP